jgi:hypothetical protein
MRRDNPRLKIGRQPAEKVKRSVPALAPEAGQPAVGASLPPSGARAPDSGRLGIGADVALATPDGLQSAGRRERRSGKTALATRARGR